MKMCYSKYESEENMKPVGYELVYKDTVIKAILFEVSSVPMGKLQLLDDIGPFKRDDIVSLNFRTKEITKVPVETAE
jgi:hypothetical protein